MPKFITRMTLRAKIIGLVIVSLLASATLIGGIDYLHSRQDAFDRANERLASETRLAASKLKTAYALMRNDAFVVSRTPPIQGLIRSLRNNGLDIQQGSTTELWRKRLATIFRSMMEARPHYTQMRYIGLAEHGKEIVRVNRREDGSFLTVSRDNLQEKKGESYFKRGLDIKPGEILFSDISYNREQGKIDPSWTPTLRVVLPVFDGAGLPFGMLVINCDYEKFLHPILAAMDHGEEIYIADRRGSYIHRERNGQISKLQIAGHYTHSAPEFISAFKFNALEKRHFRAGDHYGYRYPVVVAANQPEATIGLFFLTPEKTFMADVNWRANRTILITAGLALLAVLLSAIIAGQITRPISLMTEKIRSLSAGETDVSDLPIEASGEIGEMARAFRYLTERLDLAVLRRKQMSSQLDNFIANSADGVVVIDQDGIIQKVNSSILETLDYRQDELIGQNISIIVPEPHRSAHDGYLRQYQETGRKKFLGQIRDEKARCKDGTIIPVSLAVSEVPVDGGVVFSAIIRDMSAIERAHHEVSRYARELERSNQELDQFAYVASHDLKAPLRVIQNMSSWLEEDLDDKLTEKDRKHMNMLRSRVQRMEKLLDDLLEYSRVGRLKDDAHSEIISGRTLIEDILELLAPPPSFTIDVAAEFDTIHVTRMPLQQVLYNLINNAIKHHDRDSGTIAVNVERLSGQLRFTVSDDGPGIAPQYQEQIFDMFSTLKPRDEVEGSGMGLAIVRKTIELLGGRIEVSSGDERGATFTFTWPDEQKVTVTGAAA